MHNTPRISRQLGWEKIVISDLCLHTFYNHLSTNHFGFNYFIFAGMHTEFNKSFHGYQAQILISYSVQCRQNFSQSPNTEEWKWLLTSMPESLLWSFLKGAQITTCKMGASVKTNTLTLLCLPSFPTGNRPLIAKEGFLCLWRPFI